MSELVDQIRALQFQPSYEFAPFVWEKTAADGTRVVYAEHEAFRYNQALGDVLALLGEERL